MIGIDSQVQARMDQFRGRPQDLMQQYQMSRELIDLLALQKLKSEKDAAARSMMMQMQQNPQTIAAQREAELMGRTQQEVAQQVGGIAQLAEARKRQNLQRMASGAQPPVRMAQGGIARFAGPDGSYVSSDDVEDVIKRVADAGMSMFDAEKYIRDTLGISPQQAVRIAMPNVGMPAAPRRVDRGDPEWRAVDAEFDEPATVAPPTRELSEGVRDQLVASAARTQGPAVTTTVTPEPPRDTARRQTDAPAVGGLDSLREALAGPEQRVATDDRSLMQRLRESASPTLAEEPQGAPKARPTWLKDAVVAPEGTPLNTDSPFSALPEVDRIARQTYNDAIAAVPAPVRSYLEYLTTPARAVLSAGDVAYDEAVKPVAENLAEYGPGFAEEFVTSGGLPGILPRAIRQYGRMAQETDTKSAGGRDLSGVAQPTLDEIDAMLTQARGTGGRAAPGSVTTASPQTPADLRAEEEARVREVLGQEDIMSTYRDMIRRQQELSGKLQDPREQRLDRLAALLRGGAGRSTFGMTGAGMSAGAAGERRRQNALAQELLDKEFGITREQLGAQLGIGKEALAGGREAFAQASENARNAANNATRAAIKQAEIAAGIRESDAELRAELLASLEGSQEFQIMRAELAEAFDDGDKEAIRQAQAELNAVIGDAVRSRFNVVQGAYPRPMSDVVSIEAR